MIWIILTIIFYMAGFILAYNEQMEYETSWKERGISLTYSLVWFLVAFGGWGFDVWELIRKRTR